jgi:hypothetical protein
LSITQGLPDSFQVATAKYPINYEVNDDVAPDSFQVATAKDPHNYEVDDDVASDSIQLATTRYSSNFSNEDIGNSDNSDPFQCDIMLSSSDDDETESIKYLKRNTDPSLR